MRCHGIKGGTVIKPEAAVARVSRLSQARLLCVLCLLFSACAGVTHNQDSAGGDEPQRAIFLVSHGWHTGIVMEREAIPSELLPEAHDFAEYRYLEVGWGDRRFYTAPKFRYWLALRAALWPTASVLHLVGLRQPPQDEFPFSEVIELQLTEEGFKRLVGYIDQSFAREGDKPAAPLGPGNYGESAFYPSHERFHYFKNCNVWTARALRAASFPGVPMISITSNQLMSKARQHGRVIQPGR